MVYNQTLDCVCFVGYYLRRTKRRRKNFSFYHKTLLLLRSPYMYELFILICFLWSFCQKSFSFPFFCCVTPSNMYNSKQQNSSPPFTVNNTTTTTTNPSIFHNHLLMGYQIYNFLSIWYLFLSVRTYSSTCRNESTEEEKKRERCRVGRAL